MLIDESLAKGLRRQFWAYLTEENKKRLARLQVAAFPPAGDLLNKKIQARFFKSLDAAATSPVVLHREVTGKRAGAHWWAIYLDSDPEHGFDSWQEPALRVNVDRVWAQDQLWNPTWLTALVGEHCIARMPAHLADAAHLYQGDVPQSLPRAMATEVFEAFRRTQPNLVDLELLAGYQVSSPPTSPGFLSI